VAADEDVEDLSEGQRQLLDIFIENLSDPAEQLPHFYTRVPRFD
jgi:hypothetical protein